MGLSWDSTFIKTVPGMAMAVQAVVGAGAGFITIFPLIGGSSFQCFSLWIAALVSGLFLLTHTCNLTQTLESAFPYVTKVHLGYLVVWTTLFAIDVLWHTIVFWWTVIFSYVMLAAFLVDLFLKYRMWKAATADPNIAASPGSVESGGFGDAGGSYGTV